MKHAAFLKQITEFIFVENEPEKSDIIFIPGSGFPQLAEEASRLYHKGLATYIVPSGRYSVTQGHFGGVQEKKELYPGNYRTEWEFLSHVLTKNGVPEAAVLKEEKAMYTYENAIYSREVTDKAHLDIRQAILCCKPYHARRSLLYYQFLYPDTRFLVCPVKESTIRKDNWYLTEQGTKVVLGEIERIGVQFHEIIGEIRKEYEKNGR
ncbi:MAG TPA: YdcF family protein [Candidatus Blautia stercoravium]|nr:YdcF family protein [Candidatus Blautia stercoravium]